MWRYSLRQFLQRKTSVPSGSSKGSNKETFDNRDPSRDIRRNGWLSYFDKKVTLYLINLTSQASWSKATDVKILDMVSSLDIYSAVVLLFHKALYTPREIMNTVSPLVSLNQPTSLFFEEMRTYEISYCGGTFPDGHTHCRYSKHKFCPISQFLFDSGSCEVCQGWVDVLLMDKVFFFMFFFFCNTSPSGIGRIMYPAHKSVWPRTGTSLLTSRGWTGNRQNSYNSKVLALHMKTLLLNWIPPPLTGVKSSLQPHEGHQDLNA